MIRPLARFLPVLSLVCGALGVYLSSSPLIVLAMVMAAYVVMRGVATINGGHLWRAAPRRRRHKY